MRNASIVGFGNILKGDLGIGCYLMDALCQEPLGDAVELSYVGENLHCTGAYVCDREFAAIVGGLSLGGSGGNLHCWDKETFRVNSPWLAGQSEAIRLLAEVLARAELSPFAPKELLFLWIEPTLTEGVGMSSEMRKALRRTVHFIKEQLFLRGFLPETAFRLSSIHQLEVLSTTV